MKSLAHKLAAALAVALLVAAAQQQVAGEQQQQQQQPQPAAKAQVRERQGRSIGSAPGGANQLSSNSIEHSSSKSRLEMEKRQVQEFATTRNIIKTIIKLFFGNQDEVNATSRNVLSVITKVLDLLKNTFGQKSRNGSARTIRDSAEDAASAGVSMLQGYVKSVLAQDGHCVKRYLCQASREATRDGRDLGYVIASVGGYATSYLLDSTRQQNFNQFHEASLRGRSMKEDCAKLYSECAE